jgi:excisionase family DNA binding protein
VIAPSRADVWIARAMNARPFAHTIAMLERVGVPGIPEVGAPNVIYVAHVSIRKPKPDVRPARAADRPGSHRRDSVAPRERPVAVTRGGRQGGARLISGTRRRRQRQGTRERRQPLPALNGHARAGRTCDAWTVMPHAGGESSLVSVREVADQLGVHPETIRRLIHDGRLDAVRIGRVLRVHRDALDRFLARQRVKPSRFQA